MLDIETQRAIESIKRHRRLVATIQRIIGYAFLMSLFAIIGSMLAQGV